MKKEIADKLVAALRSGEYEQGRACLRNGENQFCCLGVLTDLYHKETGKGEWSQSEENGGIYQFLANPARLLGSDGFLPFEVVDWANMYGRTGDTREGEYEALYSMNDGDKTFSEIADHIEKNWELL